MKRIKLIGKDDGLVKFVMFGEDGKSTLLIVDAFQDSYDLYIEEVRQSNFGVALPN